MEKRVVVIHRLHQILEPFMLRRQVQDVEGKLPPKVGFISLFCCCSPFLHSCTSGQCTMSGNQAATDLSVAVICMMS